MPASFADIVDQHIEANRTELPVFDQTAMEVQNIVSGASYDAKALEQVILKDPVLSSAVLRLANSSFYGGLAEITGVRDAVVRLGASKVADLTVLVTQKSNYEMRDPELQAMVGKLWSHSVGCALGAQWLAGRLKRGDLVEQAFMAGMLHDVGKLFVLRVIDDLKGSDAEFAPPTALVHEMLGQMHCARGAALMKSWNIPEVYADIAARHHDLDFEEDESLLLLVRLVDQACNKLGIGLEPRPEHDVAASAEGQLLGVGEVVVAELEIQLEEALGLSDDL